MIPAATKLKWSEFEEDDAEDLSFLLPPVQVTGPDANGVKKVIEYKFNSENNKVKVTTTTRIRKLANARLSKRAIERRWWPKFGDAVQGATLTTMVSPEEIIVEHPRAPGTKAEENKTAGDQLSQIGKAGAVVVVCRKCLTKGDHWTARCPYKDRAPQIETFDDKPPTSEVATSAPLGTTRGSYVPPSMRPGAEKSSGSDMRRKNENSVRVTNLSEDTREPDLHELFSTFGPVSRVFVALDHKTGMSRGFGYVNFMNREDGERAINKLNGYGYDNLILRVEWAEPRAT